MNFIYTYIKHLKKFESSSKEPLFHKEDIDEIKSILVDLKDDYPYIDGEIYSRENYITIIIKPHGALKLENDLDYFTIEYTKKQLNFFQKIVEATERISAALTRECLIIQLWNSGFARYQDINIRVMYE